MGEHKKPKVAFVDLYEILGVAPDAETTVLLRRIQQSYSEAQQNLQHTHAPKRLHAQQMFHVYLPQARQVLLSEASRSAYDKQREQAIASTQSHEAKLKAEAARRQEEARVAQEVHSYCINTALDCTLVFALMATTLLFLADVLFTSSGGYPLGVPRLVALGLSIIALAFALVWHFQTLRLRVAREMQESAVKANVNALHRQSQQCKRAAFTEVTVLLIGFSVLNALDERFLPGGYPFGSRLLFNICMSLVLTVIFFIGRQCCIHCKHPAKEKHTIRKM